MANDILVKIGADITDFSKKMGETSKALKDFNKANKETFEAFKKTGKVVTGAGLALAGGLGAAVKVSADFEAGMSRVAALSGASEKELSELEKTAKNLGATTVFSTSQAADGMAFLAMAGFKTNEIIGAMPGLLNLAAAGQLDLGTAADITSNILSGFGIEAAKTNDVADVLTKTFTSSNVTMQTLGDTFKMLAPTANALGVPLEDAAAAVGLLGDAGIQGSMAGSQLSMALTRLASPAAAARDVMEELGFSAFNSSGQLKPLHQIIRELSNATSHLTEEQRASAIATIFGAQSMRSILTLMDAGADTLEGFTNELYDAGGTAEQIANKQLDNLNGQVIMLKSALEGAAISIGTALLPAIKLLTSWIQQALDWFNGLSERTKSIIAISTAVAASFMLIVGPLLMMVGFIPTIISGFSMLGTVFSALFSPVGLIIAGVIALVAGIVVLYKRSEAFQNIIASVGNLLQSTFIVAVDLARRVVDGLRDSFGKVSEIASGAFLSALERLSGIFEVLKQHASGLWISIKEIASSFSGIFSSGAESARGILASLLEVILGIVESNVLPFLQNIANALSDAFSGDFTGITEQIAKFIPAIIGLFLGGMPRLLMIGARYLPIIAEGITKSMPAILGTFTSVIDTVISGLTSFLPNFVQTGVDILVKLIEGITSALPAIVGALSLVISSLVDMLRTYLPVFIEAGIGVITNLIDGITKSLPVIIQAIISVVMLLINTLVEYLPMLIEMGLQVLTFLIDGLIQALPLLIGAALSIVVGLIQGLVASLPMIIEAGITLLMALIEGIIALLPALMDAVIQVIQTIIETLINSLPQIISAGIEILLALIDGIIQILPTLIQTAITLIVTLITTISSNLPKIIEAGIQILLALIAGIIEIIPKLIVAAITLVIELIGAIFRCLPQIIKAGAEITISLIAGIISLAWSLISGIYDNLIKPMINKFKEIDLKQIGKDIIQGLINGVTSMASAAVDKVKSIGSNIVNGVKSFFKISSPSRVLEQMGEWVGEGFAQGIEGTAKMVGKATDLITEMAVPDLRPIEMKYATTDDIYPSLTSAVSGTVDVNSRDSAVVAELKQIRGELANQRQMIVELDGRQVGRTVTPYVDEGLNNRASRRKAAWGGA